MALNTFNCEPMSLSLRKLVYRHPGGDAMAVSRQTAQLMRQVRPSRVSLLSMHASVNGPCSVRATSNAFCKALRVGKCAYLTPAHQLSGGCPSPSHVRLTSPPHGRRMGQSSKPTAICHAPSRCFSWNQAWSAYRLRRFACCYPQLLCVEYRTKTSSRPAIHPSLPNVLQPSLESCFRVYMPPLIMAWRGPPVQILGLLLP